MLPPSSEALPLPETRGLQDRCLLEICVEDAPGLEEALAGGADRIELCSALSVGGLTPSAGLMARAGAAPVPVMALIRPRSGDFVFSAPEAQVMLADIDAARAAGLAGVVLGASLPDGRLDQALLAELVARAAGMDLTLHRAFDLVPDFAEAVDQAVDLGFARILTSGGQPTALAGLEALAQIQALAAGRISIMPGAGVKAASAGQILARLGATELHSSGSVPVAEIAPRVPALGFDTPDRRITDRGAVAALRAVLDGPGQKG